MNIFCTILAFDKLPFGLNKVPHMAKQPEKSRHIGRPRSDGRPPLTKPDILRVAATLFGTEGYAGTSMRMICNELGATPSSIFNIFPNKQSILEEIYTTGVKPELAFYQRVWESGTSAATQLYKIITTDVSAVAKVDPNFKAVLGLPEARNPRFKVIYKLRKASIEHYRKLILKGIEEGDFRPLDANIVGEAVTLLGEFPVYTPSQLGKPAHQGEEIARLVFGGLVKDLKQIPAIEKAAQTLDVELTPP